MKCLGIVNLYFVYLILSSAAEASILVGCFDCSSSQSKTAALKVQKESNNQENKIQILDYKNNIVRSYVVEKDPESNTTFIRTTSASSSAIKAVQDLTNEYGRLKRDLEYVNHVSTTFSSAYNVNSASEYGIVTSDFMAQAGVIEKIGAYGSLVFGTVAKIIVNADFTLDIAFNDGSYIRFKVSGITVDGDVEFEIVDSYDSDGNKIPKDKSDIGGRYEFTAGSGNADRFKDILVLHGVDVTGWEWGLTPSAGGTVYIEDCINACKLKPN
jgi:hypothetical protein